MAFDKFMVVNEIASNAKVARLTDGEFRCLLQGVWPMASKSSPRGYLLVGSLAAEPRDIANQARCSVTVAARTMDKLRLMGMIVLDESVGWEFCHDWDEINPTPKKDLTNAERQARFRAKRNGVTNGAVTPPETADNAREVEVEEEENNKRPSRGMGLSAGADVGLGDLGDSGFGGSR